MKNKDDLKLEQAYQLVQEGMFKNALAAATMGLGALNGAQAAPQGITPDDMADKEMIQSIQNPEAASITNPYQALEVARESISNGTVPSNDVLMVIAPHKDMAKRVVYLLFIKQMKVPELLIKATGNYLNELEQGLMGPKV